MAGCGYVCPKCEGKEVLEDGTPCDWCLPVSPKTTEQNATTETSE